MAKLWKTVSALKPPAADAPNCSGLGRGGAGCCAGRTRGGVPVARAGLAASAGLACGTGTGAMVAAAAAATTTGCVRRARARVRPGVPLSRREMGAAAARSRHCCALAVRSTGAAGGVAGSAAGALGEVNGEVLGAAGVWGTGVVSAGV